MPELSDPMVSTVVLSNGSFDSLYNLNNIRPHSYFQLVILSFLGQIPLFEHKRNSQVSMNPARHCVILQ